MFGQLFNSPFLYSLSLTLVHFLWQGLLVGLILKSALFIIDTNHSRLRYTLATLAMLANALLAMLTFTMVYPDTGSGINSNLSPIPLTSLVNELTQQNALLNYQELLPSILAYSLPYISLLWLATIAILASKLIIEVRNVNYLPFDASVPPSSVLLARFEVLAKQIKLPRTPALLISLKAEVPMAIGWLKPVVLLPARMVTGLDSAQLEMLILHELAHIRRHDYLVNFIQTIIEILFFFHPMVHWIGKQMRNEREYCSDDIAVHHCGDAIAYAHTLTDTASLCAKGHTHTIPTMAMAASGGDLKARVVRLVDHHCAPSNNTSKWLAGVSLLLALTLLSINQLLTMPFAQQLNNQFPWQEGNSLSNSIFRSTKTIASGESTVNNETITLKRDSIAQQLLNREGLATIGYQAEVIESSIIINVAKEKTNVLTTNTMQSLDVESGSFLSSKTQENIPSTTKSIDLSSNEQTQLLAKTFVISEQAVEKSTQSEVNFSTDDAVGDSFDIEKIAATITYQKQVNSLPAAITLVPTTLSLQENQPLQVNVSPIKVSNAVLTTQPVADDINNVFINKKSPYTKLSYRQEIDKLATQNNLYEASSSNSTIHNPAIKNMALATTTQKLAKPIVTNDAELLKSISPVYPSLAKRRGIEMEVKVDFTIDRNGRVKDIYFDPQSKIVYFKSAIRSAIRKWRFSPATQNDLSVESKMSKIFSFSLHK